MFFKLSDEQLMIQTMVREFSRKVIAVTADERDRNEEYPSENLKKMGELGLLGMMIPYEYEGEGADTLSYVLALIEVAYSCASTAVIMSVHNSPVCACIYQYGNEDQKNRFLKPLAKGQHIGAFALTEPMAGSDAVNLSTTAIRDNNYYIINGIKRFITSGKNSRLVVVLAKTNDSGGSGGLSAFLVKKDTPGLIIGQREDKMGLRASDTTDLIFEDCRVPVKNRLGEEGEGFKIAMTCLDSGRIGIAAQAIGVAQAAFDAAVKHAKTRYQFGHQISEFQGLRWIFADMATDIEAARQLTYSASAMKDRGERYSSQASMAKLFASEMANRVTAKALQIHGGYGYIKDYPVERYYRDARVFTIYEGTSEIQRLVISNNIFKKIKN